MDDVPVIDDVAMLSAGMRPPAAQRHQRGRAEEAFEPVIVEPHAKPVADQARRHRIEHLLEDEPAGRSDGDDGLLVIRRPARRQRLQGRALEIEPLAVASIAAPDDLVDKTAIGLQVVEVARSAQQQRVLDRLFEMAVRAFDRPVLVRHAAIVAGRLHAVMRAQRLVAARLILPRVVVEIAEGGRQAVAAMLQGSAAERPQRILQALGQCHEALTAEHDMSMLPAREGQAEVVEPVIQRRTGDADAAFAHIGEIGQPQPTRWMLLPEDDVLLSPVQRSPAANAPLQRAADAGADLGVAAADLVENGDRPQARNALEQRHHLAVPNRGQRILPPAVAWRFLLRREPGVLLNAKAVAALNPALAAATVGVSAWRELMYDLIWQSVMWRPGKLQFLIGMKNPLPIRSTVTARQHGPLRGRAVHRIRNVSRATPSFRHASGD